MFVLCRCGAENPQRHNFFRQMPGDHYDKRVIKKLTPLQK